MITGLQSGTGNCAAMHPAKYPPDGYYQRGQYANIFAVSVMNARRAADGMMKK